MSKHTKTEQTEAKAALLERIAPGSTVYTVLRRASRSGVARSISPVIVLDGEPVDISWRVARVLGLSVDSDNGGVKVEGGGTDMGFGLVYDLGLALFGHGDDCARLGYHTGRNGDTEPETGGGYLLNQR